MGVVSQFECHVQNKPYWVHLVQLHHTSSVARARALHTEPVFAAISLQCVHENSSSFVLCWLERFLVRDHLVWVWLCSLYPWIRTRSRWGQEMPWYWFLSFLKRDMCSVPDMWNNSRCLYNLLIGSALRTMDNHKSNGTLKTYLLTKGLVHMYRKQQNVKDPILAMCWFKWRT